MTRLNVLTVLLLLVSCSWINSLSAQSLPDLVVTNISLVPVPESGRIYTGTTIQVPVKVTIKNTGTQSLIWRPDYQIFIGVELYVANRRFFGGVKSLRAGESAAIYLSATIPATYSGRSTQFSAVVDPCNKYDDVAPCPVGGFRELNEGNNTRSAYLKIPVYKKVLISYR